MSNVASLNPPLRKNVAILEERAEKIFTAAIRAAFEGTCDEARRLDLGELQIERLIEIMHGALEVARSGVAGL